MSDKYRIEITRFESSTDDWDTLLVVEGSRDIVRAALGFAPAALGDEQAPSEQSAPVNGTSAYSFEDTDKPKRQRRTKAEMEAARAAEAAQTSPAPVTAPAGVTTEAPLSTPVTYPATPYNPFAPVAS